jgi:hypothetical protein
MNPISIDVDIQLVNLKNTVNLAKIGCVLLLCMLWPIFCSFPNGNETDTLQKVGTIGMRVISMTVMEELWDMQAEGMLWAVVGKALGV